MCPWIGQDLYSVDPKSTLGYVFVFNAYERIKGHANNYAELCNFHSFFLSVFCSILFLEEMGREMSFSL